MRIGLALGLLMALAFAGCGEVKEHSGTDAGNPSKGGGSATGGSSGTATGGRGSGGIPTATPRPDAGDVPIAQAAVTLSSAPAPGKTCTTTNGQLSFPSKYNASVYAELNCDLSAGCKPDDYIVVDRDRGTTVICSVSPAGDNFNVQLSLQVDGSATNEPSVQFGLAGLVSKTGGMVSISESNSLARGGGTQSDCAVTIAPPSGIIKPGAIWGSFDCPNFRDERNIADTGCELKGQFLFENCGP